MDVCNCANSIEDYTCISESSTSSGRTRPSGNSTSRQPRPKKQSRDRLQSLQETSPSRPPNLEILQQPNSAPPSHSHPRNFPGHAWSLSQLVTTSAQFFPPQNLTLIPEAFPSRISWSHGLPRWALTSSTSPHCVSAGRDCLQAVLLGPGRSRCRLRYCSLRLAYPLPLRPDRRKRRVEFFGILHPYWWYRTSVSGNGANQDRTGRVSPGIFGRCHGCSPILASTV